MQPSTTTYNHPRPPTSTGNHPKPPATIHNSPQSSKTIQKPTDNYPQPPTTTKITQKAKTCHKKLCYCILDVNTETDVDFDMK